VSSPTDTVRKPGRPARLDRDQILQAAFSIADEEGLEAATMRAIGERLGVEAMSLYRHVRNKDDLLDGLVDMVFSEMVVPRATRWKTALRERCVLMRQALNRHPWSIGLMESRMQPGPANLRHRDDVLAVLLEAGFKSPDATHAYNVLDSYVYGFVLQEKELPFSNAKELAEVGESLLAQVPADLYPNLSTVSAELLANGFDFAAEFEFGLDLILDAIERFRESREPPRK
jgi:AcrR family transcriptional regulator